MPPLVLASASPRREQLLRQLGLDFRVSASGLDEEQAAPAGAAPAVMVRELALAKARAVAAREPAAVVLAADTVVVLDGEVLGKPASPAAAEEMLARLQGRTHRVFTGVAAVAPGGAAAAEVEETRVTVRPLTRAEIRAYVASGEPLDKAGGYAIQGRGALLVTRVEGCYYNVVGLPLARAAAVLARVGFDLWGAVMGR